MAHNGAPPDPKESSSPPPKIPPPSSWREFLYRFLRETNWSLVLLIAFAFVMLAAVLSDRSVLGRLADTEYARGVITFLVALATIALAFMFTYQSFFGTTSEEGFRRGREIFTAMMGVLGTIVGFYFGSADRTGVALQVDGHFERDAFIVHATGGAPPYRISVSLDPPQGEPAETLASRDGWFAVPLKGGMQQRAQVIIIDSKNRQATADFRRPMKGTTSLQAPVPPSTPASPNTAPNPEAK